MRATAALAILVFANACFAQTPAQDSFNRGVIALHNAGYETAATHFQAAQKSDPNFVMAYWGEAMTFNHTFAAEQDIAGGRRALAKLGSTRAARAVRAKTPRERDYLSAVELLYGEGDKDTRDLRFAAAMEKLHAGYPDDIEAAAFHALALLGTLRYGDRTFSIQAKAAAIARTVLQKSPNHPGGLHYLIHACDDPQHAHLALDAARKYERIADPNSHALHMPSHIYVQLGLWPDVARANRAAFDASAGQRRDYHSLEWLMYAQIQMGQYSKAREHPALILRTARETGAPGMSGYAATVASRFAVETALWDALAPYPMETRTAELLFAQGMAELAKGSSVQAIRAIAVLDSLAQENTARGVRVRATVIGSLAKMLGAQLALFQKRFGDAERLASEAVRFEAATEFPSGPPDLIKPAYEFYGEVLLAANKPAQAAEQFTLALKRTPKRAMSLLGLARTRAAQKDTAGATKAYRELYEIWVNADPTVPAVREVRSFLKIQ